MAGQRTEDMVAASDDSLEGSEEFNPQFDRFGAPNPPLVIPGVMADHVMEVVVTTGAKKYDNGKVDLSLNPLVAMEEMAKAFMLGEKKYGRYNFYKGMESHRLVAAAMRHLTAWNEGESLDPESGNSHLGHVLACIAMILQQEKLGTLKDTRYKP